VAFVGIGGCGMNLLDACMKHLPDEACCIAINRDAQRLNQADGDLYKVFLAEVSALDGQGELLPISPAQVQASMHKHMGELTNKLQGCDAVVLMAGLGGATGTWASQPVLAHLKSMAKQVKTVLVLPFNFEQKRLLIARESLTQFCVSDYLLVCSNQDLIRHSLVHTSMLNAFNAMCDQICNGLHQLEKKSLAKGVYRMCLQADGLELLPVEGMKILEVMEGAG